MSQDLIGKLKIYYSRSIALSKTLGIFIPDLLDFHDGEIKDENNPIKGYYKSKITSLKKNDPKHNMLKELLSIEFEKAQLYTPSNLDKIKENDVKLNIQREEILSISYDELCNKKIVQNPFVNTYESSWEFINNATEKKFSTIEMKGDYYFVFQLTGMFDRETQTSILEFPLHKLEYYFLQLSETPVVLIEVINEFKKVFDINDLKEENTLNNEIKTMIRKLLFRKFLIFYKEEEYSILKNLSLQRRHSFSS
ncbi:hypothetical protein [Aquimarina algiphila]|uniref:Uncharacterized protein n=1 Tax=Aquimarina algiphila TaxID=2047982 RepID=A0A554VHX8_9FLAO|nr:hypothetical protein [Aquimarina algiphila]TSE07183.1 hypothetical protein FOF46_16820 [Aquimarina algiphila]